MHRRSFLRMAAAAPAAVEGAVSGLPRYTVVTPHRSGGTGMPGLFPARVTAVYRDDSIDPETEIVNVDAVREMMRQGMQSFTGEKEARDGWARFISPTDVVGIKVNASGAPGICSHPVVIGEIARNLVAVGVNPQNIWVHERFKSQVDTVPYAEHLPKGAHIQTADSFMGYDPFTYVETNFFGEDDTRSNLVRMVTEKFTKIINVPNMKDHSASGVTGCLKNIAYGEFSNVARSHQYTQTNTLSFIGTLANIEPLRSKTVLAVMDGLKGVWHAGPFSPSKKFRFYPKQIRFGTDPVAMDRLLLDVIEDKRKQENALSVWDRSEKYLDGAGRKFANDPNVNRFLREPGHIEFAAKLGLGTHDRSKIDLREVRL